MDPFHFQPLPALQERIDALPRDWIEQQLHALPLPIAHVLQGVQRESLPWESLLKDLLHATVKYYALLSMAGYLSSGRVDREVNRLIRDRLSAPVSDGSWCQLLHRCAPLLPPSFGSLGKAVHHLDKTLQVEIHYHPYGHRPQAAGIFRSLVSLRNRLFAHARAVPNKHRKPIVRALLPLYGVLFEELNQACPLRLVYDRGDARPALHGPRPRWVPSAGHPPDGPRVRLLDGVSEVARLDLLSRIEPAPSGTSGALPPAHELYQLSELQSGRVEFTGVAVGRRRYRRQHPALQEILDQLRKAGVFETYVEDAGPLLKRHRESLAGRLAEDEWVVAPPIERASVLQTLDAFVEGEQEEDQRLLWLLGPRGTGKTTLLAHWALQRLRQAPNIPLIWIDLHGRSLPDAIHGTLRGFSPETSQTARAWVSALFTELKEAGRSVVLLLEGLDEERPSQAPLLDAEEAMRALLDEHRNLQVVASCRLDPTGVPAVESVLDSRRGVQRCVLPEVTPDEAQRALRLLLSDLPELHPVLEEGAALTTPGRIARYARATRQGYRGTPEPAAVSAWLIDRVRQEEPAVHQILQGVSQWCLAQRTTICSLEALREVDAASHDLLRNDLDRGTRRVTELGLLRVRSVRRLEETHVELELPDDVLFRTLATAFEREALLTRVGGVTGVAMTVVVSSVALALTSTRLALAVPVAGPVELRGAVVAALQQMCDLLCLVAAIPTAVGVLGVGLGWAALGLRRLEHLWSGTQPAAHILWARQEEARSWETLRPRALVVVFSALLGVGGTVALAALGRRPSSALVLLMMLPLLLSLLVSALYVPHHFVLGRRAQLDAHRSPMLRTALIGAGARKQRTSRALHAGALGVFVILGVCLGLHLPVGWLPLGDGLADASQAARRSLEAWASAGGQLPPAYQPVFFEAAEPLLSPLLRWALTGGLLALGAATAIGVLWAWLTELSATADEARAMPLSPPGRARP